MGIIDNPRRRFPRPRRCGLALAAALLLAWGQPRLAAQARGGSPPPTHIEPAAQALLSRTIQALGGAAFLNFKTMNSSGRSFSIADGVTQGFVQYQSAMDFPAKRRLSYGFSKKSKAVMLINDGDQGWEMDRYGLVEQSPEEIRAWMLANRYSLENLLRVRVHEPGTLVQAGGEDFVDNIPVQILDVFDARQVEIKIYLNQATGLPVQVAYRIHSSDAHDWNDYSDVYSNYQPAGGVQTAMHIVRYKDGSRIAETFRADVRYNSLYPPDYFQPKD